MKTERPESQPGSQAGPTAGDTAAGAGQPRIRWDGTAVRSSYANVCNVSSTREEVVLIFGINQAWERGKTEVQVQLTDRIILSPFAAKRLAGLLGNVVREYETRFGELRVDRAAGGAERT